MTFAEMLIKRGVTTAGLDDLVVTLDDEDGGDFMYTYPGRYIKRLINDIRYVFKEERANYLDVLLSSQALVGAVNVLFEDDRISDTTMDEVERITGKVLEVYLIYTRKD